MATAPTLKQKDDKFCVCFICLEQLKEPKQLPCLHRFCKDCLRSIIHGSNDVIKCPVCREEIQIPTNGAEGFKTDFYSKSLVECLNIQHSLKNAEMRECYCCSEHLRVAAYCFKCNEFLCKDCHNFHVTNKIVKDHQKHTLSLEDIEAKNITVEKLASMRDAPRCHIHLEETSKLFCETCGNLPVCIACTYGKHKEHVLHEVTALDEMKREKLTNKLKSLGEIEKKKKNLMEPAQAKPKLMLNVSIEKEKVTKMHDEKDKKIKKKIQDVEWKIEQLKQEKQNTEKEIFDFLQIQRDQDIQKVNKRYEEIFKEKKLEISHTFDERENSLEKKLIKLRETLELMQRDKEQLLESIDKQLNDNVKIMETMSEHNAKIKQRFKTLNTMASSILASDNNWSAVQCIPDMCTAASNLIKDFKREFPESSTLTHVTVNYKQYSFGKQSFTKMSYKVKTEISPDYQYRFITGMTSSDDGNIVISGISLDELSSFIIVIDVNGTVLKQKTLNIGSDRPSSVRYCKYLSRHRVASVCVPDEIGLYDVRDGSYIKKNISDVIKSWPKGRNVMCVATDLDNKNILVGGYNSRDVYVFDDQLNYLHILTLPEVINWSRDITVSYGHLLVCDEAKAYKATMDGPESKMMGEFMEPNVWGCNYAPTSVCTDEDGFVYMLWRMCDKFEGQWKILVQYNQDGSKILTTRMVDGDATVITVLETSQGEKLLVATHYTQKVTLYDLTTEE